jgi:peroxiredoxin
VLGEIEAKGASLVGISVDSKYSHRAFREKLGLTMPLLADFHPKGEVTRAYDAWIEKVGHGNRSLVLVEDGVVRWSYESPSPGEIPGANLIFDALES